MRFFVGNTPQRTAFIEWLRHVGGFEQVDCVSFADLARLASWTRINFF